MPFLVKDSNVIRQQSALVCTNQPKAADNPDISAFQLFCDVVVTGRAWSGS